MTNLLLDLVVASKPSRIVTVSSSANEFGQIHFDDINLKENYGPWTAYGQSKLANVMFSRELGKRLKGQLISLYIAMCLIKNTL